MQGRTRTIPGWYVLEYQYVVASDTNIVRQVLPLSFVNPRIKDIELRHGRSPESTHYMTNTHLDYGGAVRMDEAMLTITLGKNRDVSLFAYQAPFFAVALAEASMHSLGGRQCVRLTTWPGRMTYFSLQDLKILQRRLKEVA